MGRTACLKAQPFTKSVILLPLLVAMASLTQSTRCLPKVAEKPAMEQRVPKKE